MRLRILLLSILFVAGFIPTTVKAQDDPCTDALTAAQDAYDAGDFVTADVEVETAITACVSDILKYRDAIALQQRIGLQLDNMESIAEREAAVPGEVDLGPYSIFMECQGQGSPVVIFENALGAGHGMWDNVFSTVTETTRACRYDRLGVGWSDRVPDDEPRTAFTQAQELHAVLETVNLSGPFVLVGQELAGIHLIAFTYLYPDEVAGVVFVNARHPYEREALIEVRPGLANSPETLGLERFDWDATLEEFEAEEGVGDFGAIPVYVLTALNGLEEDEVPVWLELQEEHAARSTISEHVVMERTGAAVQDEQPQAVIDGIQWVIEQSSETDDADTDTQATETSYLITPEVYVNQFQEAAADHQLIDVRTPEEFAEGYIEGAVNIPVQEIADRLDEVATDKPVVVYCRSGNRSATARQILLEAGYTEVYDLGGITDWINAGLPVVE